MVLWGFLTISPPFLNFLSVPNSYASSALESSISLQFAFLLSGLHFSLFPLCSPTLAPSLAPSPVTLICPSFQVIIFSLTNSVSYFHTSCHGFSKYEELAKPPTEQPKTSTNPTNFRPHGGMGVGVNAISCHTLHSLSSRGHFCLHPLLGLESWRKLKPRGAWNLHNQMLWNQRITRLEYLTRILKAVNPIY